MLVLSGHRPSAPDLALFAISLLVFGGATAGVSTTSPESVTFSAKSSQVNAHTIDIHVDVGTGSVALFFSDDPGLGYQVNFTRSFGFGFLFPSTYALTNRTSGDTLFLNATSDSYSVLVTLGRSYETTVNVNAGTGGIEVRAPDGNVKAMVLSTGTGSIGAVVSSVTLTNLQVKTGTGSIHLDANDIAPAGKSVPITVSAGTGSVDVQMSFVSGSAVSLSASTGLGSLSHSLQGFTVTQSSSNSVKATAGFFDAPKSFAVDVSTGTGSLSVTARMLG